jgi:hypothetical protein
VSVRGNSLCVTVNPADEIQAGANDEHVRDRVKNEPLDELDESDREVIDFDDRTDVRNPYETLRARFDLDASRL